MFQQPQSTVCSKLATSTEVVDSGVSLACGVGMADAEATRKARMAVLKLSMLMLMLVSGSVLMSRSVLASECC